MYIFVVLTACILATTVSACDPTRFVFTFGHSYSTTGFSISGVKPSPANPFGNPAYPGQTTDGPGNPNWVNVMINELSPSNTLSYNFAVYAATVNNSVASWNKTIPDFVQQVSLFQSNLVPAPANAQWNGSNSVFMVYFGTNDIDINWNNMPNDPTIIQRTMNSYFNLLDSLYSSGARKFVVFIVEPLMRTPLWSNPPFYQYSSTGRADVLAWNGNLTSGVNSFKASHKDAQVTTLDTQGVFNNILNNPTAYGSPDQFCNNTNGVSCLWQDALHPGLAIQRSLGKAAYNAASSVGFYS